MGWEIALQIGAWILTIAAVLGILLAAIDFLDGGSILGVRSPNFDTSAMLRLLVLATLTYFFAFGFKGLLWFMPEFVSDDEGTTRSGAALSTGFMLSMAWVLEASPKVRRLNNRSKKFLNIHALASDMTKGFYSNGLFSDNATQILEDMIAQEEKKVASSNEQRFEKAEKIEFYRLLRNHLN